MKGASCGGCSSINGKVGGCSGSAHGLGAGLGVSGDDCQGHRTLGNPLGNGSSSVPRGTPPPPPPSTMTGLSQGLPGIATGTMGGPLGSSPTGANQPGFGGAPVRGCFAGSQNLSSPLRKSSAARRLISCGLSARFVSGGGSGNRICTAAIAAIARSPRLSALAMRLSAPALVEISTGSRYRADSCLLSSARAEHSNVSTPRPSALEAECPQQRLHPHRRKLGRYLVVRRPKTRVIPASQTCDQAPLLDQLA